MMNEPFAVFHHNICDNMRFTVLLGDPYADRTCVCSWSCISIKGKVSLE